METFLILLQLAIVLAMIFIGAKVGGIGLGIYGMVGVFVLVFIFGLDPGVIPIDVMLIIVSVITASAGVETMSDVRGQMSDVWYDLFGRKLNSKPTQPGMYIFNGKAVVVN